MRVHTEMHMGLPPYLHMDSNGPLLMHNVIRYWKNNSLLCYNNINTVLSPDNRLFIENKILYMS